MPLAKLALGIGLGAAAALAVKEARRSRVAAKAHAREDRKQDDQLGLRPHEPSAAAIHRMTIAQLDLAIHTLLSTPGSDIDLDVHETRKAIKRLRTMQRLLEDGRSRTREERRRALLREAATALAGARDSKVALDTLEALMRRHPQTLAHSPGVSRLHATLLSEHDAAQQALTRSDARERAVSLLQAAHAEAAADERDAQAKRRDARVVEAGLLLVYARGRRAMRAARRHKRIAEMHEWRKRVKDLRYAAEALSPHDRAAAKKQRRQARLRDVARQADKLGETLGEEHDLALLAKRVRDEEELFRGDRASRKALLRAIRRRRRQLRKRAFSAGFVLYERKPKRWAKRLPRAR